MSIWSLLDADCMLRKVLPQWFETVWSWLAQLCNLTAQGGLFQPRSGCGAWQPNDAPLPDPEIKTQEDPSSTAGGNKSSSHFPRGFFAPIGFAQPSCSGYGSRRQESQRCQRQRCQGELIWKLPYTAVAAEAFGTWQQWNGWQRHLRLLWSFHGLQSLDGMVSVNRYSFNRLCICTPGKT